MAQRPLIATLDLAGPFQVEKHSLVLSPRDTRPPATVEPASPVAWWKFEEPSGAIAVNAAGTNFPGQILGEPRRGSGQADTARALEFDGQHNWVKSPGSEALDFRQGISVAAWFRVGAFDRVNQTLVAKGNAWRLQRQGENGMLEFTLNGPVPSGSSRRHAPTVSSKRAVDDGKWHLVTVSYDGKRIALCLDGVEEDMMTASGAIALNALPLTLGENEASPGRFFHGSLGEVRVFARGLGAEELKQFHP